MQKSKTRLYDRTYPPVCILTCVMGRSKHRKAPLPLDMPPLDADRKIFDIFLKLFVVVVDCRGFFFASCSLGVQNGIEMNSKHVSVPVPSPSASKADKSRFSSVLGGPSCLVLQAVRVLVPTFGLHSDSIHQQTRRSRRHS